MARQDEALVSIRPELLRKAQAAGLPARVEDWDQEQAQRAYECALKLFRKGGFAIPTEPAAELPPAPNHHLKVLHFNQAVAFLDDETGEERHGTVVDHEWSEDETKIVKYRIKSYGGKRKFVWMESKFVWALEEAVA